MAQKLLCMLIQKIYWPLFTTYPLYVAAAATYYLTWHITVKREDPSKKKSEMAIFVCTFHTTFFRGETENIQCTWQILHQKYYIAGMRLTSYLYVCLDKHPHINQDCLCMREYIFCLPWSSMYTKTDGILLSQHWKICGMMLTQFLPLHKESIFLRIVLPASRNGHYVVRGQTVQKLRYNNSRRHIMCVALYIVCHKQLTQVVAASAMIWNTFFNDLCWWWWCSKAPKGVYSSTPSHKNTAVLFSNSPYGNSFPFTHREKKMPAFFCSSLSSFCCL